MSEVLNEIIALVTSEAVLIPVAAIFVFSLIGNLISFGNRFTNALITAIIVAVVFVAYEFATGGTIAADDLETVLIIAGVVFVADLIGNLLSFNSRVASALATTFVSLLMLVAVFYVLKSYIGPLPQ